MDYGICRYDPDAYNPVAEVIEVYDLYEAVYQRYLSFLSKEGGFRPPKDLWIAYIENNRIVQLDKLQTETKCCILPYTENK